MSLSAMQSRLAGTARRLRCGVGTASATRKRKPACCGQNICSNCTTAPSQYTISFSGVTLANNLCCFVIGTQWLRYDLGLSLGTWCIEHTTDCVWQGGGILTGAKVWNAVAAYGGPYGGGCTPTATFSTVTISIRLVRTATQWQLAVTTPAGGGSSLFNAVHAVTANDCNGPPSFTNTLGAIGCPSGLHPPLGTGGSAVIVVGC
jgi:hypothetical protein